MVLLNQILGTALMGVVSTQSAADLARMNQTLRTSEERKNLQTGRRS
ncbi:hypothetical protein [Roseibium aquae]|nr:hypothetical protein [Roseibium aquae]